MNLSNPDDALYDSDDIPNAEDALYPLGYLKEFASRNTRERINSRYTAERIDTESHIKPERISAEPYQRSANGSAKIDERCGIPPYPHDFDGVGYRPEVPSAMSTQVGGNHYSKLAIQPGEYAMANNLNYWQGNVIKYVTRYKNKNGKQDLEKAIDCLKKLLEAEYPSDTVSRS